MRSNAVSNNLLHTTPRAVTLRVVKLELEDMAMDVLNLCGLAGIITRCLCRVFLILCVFAFTSSALALLFSVDGINLALDGTFAGNSGLLFDNSRRIGCDDGFFWLFCCLLRRLGKRRLCTRVFHQLRWLGKRR